MALNYVTLTLNLQDGQGNPVSEGWVQLVPSAPLTDAADGADITQAPIVGLFRKGLVATVSLLATDNAAVLPAGWGWTIKFVNIPGNPAPFSFFLPAAPFAFTATNASPCVFTAAGSSYANGALVALSGGSLPFGFPQANYYVVGAAGTSFSLALTPGGTAINSSSTGSGTVATAGVNLSSVSPVSSVVTMQAYLPLPSGTAVAGQVPVATTNGSTATAWGTVSGGGGLANPMTALGDVISGGAAGAPARVPANTAATRKFLRELGTGTVGAAPAWDTLTAGDLPAGLGSLGAVVTASGDTSGATDQAAITAAEAAGGTVYFASGTFWVTGLTKQANTVWQGSGRNSTIIKLANGANADVVAGAGFSTLTLGGNTAAGIGGWGIRDLAIDGNKTNQSGTSYGLRVYGYNFDVTNVSIRNCLTDGMYTEWANFGGASIPDKNMEARFYGLKIHDNNGNGWRNRGPHDSRAYDITFANNGAVNYWGESNNPTTVAAGSNGVNVSTFAGAGVLNVATTLGWNTASIGSTQGALTVVTSGVTAVVTYTGTTATSFTGCTTISGSGTVSTSAAVTPVGAYSAAGVLLFGAHAYGTSASWHYMLDTQTHLTDCVAEVAATGMYLIRCGSCQLIGGLGIIYSQFTQTGLGIQLGDAANAATGSLIRTYLSNLADTGASTSSLNIVNDGGSNDIDLTVYAPAGSTVISGTPNKASRYRVRGAGTTRATNALNSQLLDAGQYLWDVPAAAPGAYRISAAGTDLLNINTSASRVEFPAGYLTRWYSDQYSTVTASVNGSTGAASFGSLVANGALSTTPAVLTDAASILVNAALSNMFRVTLGGNRTLASPTNPVDGQAIAFEVIQDGTGSRTLAYGAAYSFPAGIGTPVLSSSPASHDFIAFRYDAAATTWYCVGFVPQAATAVPATVSQGGTGDSSLTAYALLAGGTTSTGAVQSLAGLGASGNVLTSNGPAALPTFQASAAGFANPMTTLGDLIYENATPAAVRLAGQTTATKNFLTQTGTGTVSAAPSWGTIAAGDLPAATTSTQGAVSLDGTAADILQVGTAAGAGVSAKAPAADHVHASPLLVPADFTQIAWTVNDPGAVSSSVAPVSGSLYLMSFTLRQIATLAKIGIHVFTAGATLTAGDNLMGIYGPTGTLLGQTADQSGVWTTAGAYNTSLTAAISNAAVGKYWVGILAVGTTPPGLRAGAPSSVFANLGLSGTALRCAINGTGLTALPGSVTLSSNVAAGSFLFAAVIS